MFKAFKQEAEVIWLGTLFQKVVILVEKMFAYIEEEMGFVHTLKLLILVILAVIRVYTFDRLYCFFNLYFCI